MEREQKLQEEITYNDRDNDNENNNFGRLLLVPDSVCTPSCQRSKIEFINIVIPNLRNLDMQERVEG